LSALTFNTLSKVFCAAHDGTQGDDQDIDQSVAACSPQAWIDQRAEVGLNAGWGLHSSVKPSATAQQAHLLIHPRLCDALALGP
jgi:hypothetical protein